MASQEEFLKTVREALAQSRAGAHDAPAPEPPVASPDPSAVVEKAQVVRKRLLMEKKEAMERLAEMAELQGWKLIKVSSRAEVAAALVELAKSLGATSVVRSSHPVLEETDVDGTLSAVGVQVVPLTVDPEEIEGSRDRMREAAAEADMGITGVDYIVAETATAALVSRRGNSRLVSLLPPVHVAVVEPEQVVETMGDLLALRQAELLENDGAPWYMNLISGPSRTADIEQTIVIGVHGPREVYLMLVAGDSSEN